MSGSRFFILNSFDRSGSTLISKALAKHPHVECLYNPFNSSVFRREFMTYWNRSTDARVQEEGRMLVNNVLSGNIDEETVKSKVFFSNSSATTVEDGKIYVIKTTNLHLKARWFKDNYPDVEFLCLLRNPLGILASLVRNDFHIAWYSGWAFDDLKSYINAKYPDEIAGKLLSVDDEVSKMAVIIGVLNATMRSEIMEHDTIRYENVIEDPNSYLRKLMSRYVGDDFDYSPAFRRSVNAVGKPFEGVEQYQKIFSKDQIERYVSIFNLCGDLGYDL